MIALTLIAVLVAMLLVGSASARLSDASATDDASTGGWGVIQRHRRRRRALPAQARRWQTAMSRADSDDVRWAQLVDYLDTLESAAGGRPDAAQRPEALNGRYLQSRIDALNGLVAATRNERTETETRSTNDT